jgi:hypothetical protein
VTEVLVATGTTAAIGDPGGGAWTRVTGVDMTGFLTARLAIHYVTVTNFADTRHTLRWVDVNPHTTPLLDEFYRGNCAIDNAVDSSRGPFVLDPVTHAVYLFAAACNGGSETFTWSIYGDDVLYYFDPIRGVYSNLPLLTATCCHDPMLDAILASVKATYA